MKTTLEKLDPVWVASCNEERRDVDVLRAMWLKDCLKKTKRGDAIFAGYIALERELHHTVEQIRSRGCLLHIGAAI